jgi:predicted AlkP superfamily phosphohydrolase/phosphomutase
LLKNLKEIEDCRLKTALHLMKKYPCDVFVIVLTLLDRVQHYFWRFMDKGHAGYSDEGARRFGRVICDCYGRMDEAIGEIMTSSSGDTTFIVMSDHGAGLHYSDFHVNKWLRDTGWLKMKFCPRPVLNRSSIRRVLVKLGLEQVSRKLPESVNSLPVFVPRIKRERDFNDIKWTKTLAYSALYGISVNLKGRENEGIVEPGEEYHKVLKELKIRLQQLIDPQTGETLVEKVLESNEMYTGPYSMQGPDLLFLTRDLNCIPSDSYSTHSWFETRVNHATSGTHRMDGIFMMKGKEVKKTDGLQNLQITDVVPTMLYLLQMPVPRDMDGRVITEAFTPEYLRENRIRFTDLSSGERSTKERRSTYSDKEEEALKESLKGLGYLS